MLLKVDSFSCTHLSVGGKVDLEDLIDLITVQDAFIIKL